MNFIDTADSYGPGTSEEVLGEALFPYADGLVIGTKVGQTGPSRNEWRPLGRPEYIRQQCELSLRKLRLDRIDLYQRHRIDPKVPADEQFGVRSGNSRTRARSATSACPRWGSRPSRRPASRSTWSACRTCTISASAGTRPWSTTASGRTSCSSLWVPIASGDLAASDGPLLGRIAKQLDATPAQVALAWLLRRSPVIVPIPGSQ